MMDFQANQAPPRNIQLDFFRGVALMIIFINHIPANDFLRYTPSRYGLSDAAEIFVFLSGYAAAIAYGRCFRSSGLLLGSVRVFYRCAQIYAAHLGLFMLLAAVCVLGNAVFGEEDYIAKLNIQHFFDNTQEAILGLITLRYVPNYFDILPMYLVVMLWIPVVWVLSRIHVALALAFPIALYLAMWWFGLELSADMHGDRPWFFNPFGWQLIFFTGFALGSGWILPPRRMAWLVTVCSLILLFSLPLSPEPALRPTAFLTQLHQDLRPWLDKTQFGLLRWAHFLALAYLVRAVLTNRAQWLQHRTVRPIVHMGQQSLPIFVLSMCLSYAAGMVLDWAGRGAFSTAWVNVAGLAMMLLAAQALTWLDSKPWKTASGATAGQGYPAGYALLGPGETLRIWTREALLLSLLVFLAISPLLLLQGSAKSAAGRPTVTAGLWRPDVRRPSEDAVPESGIPIEWRERF